jgi:large subunit ribosomal protein L18
VFRSNKFTYAQLIDDSKGTTLVSVTNKTTKDGGTKSDAAEILGTQLASLAKKKKIERIVFDRSGYAYHGRIKRLADAARAGGLKF